MSRSKRVLPTITLFAWLVFGFLRLQVPLQFNLLNQALLRAVESQGYALQPLACAGVNDQVPIVKSLAQVTGTVRYRPEYTGQTGYPIGLAYLMLAQPQHASSFFAAAIQAGSKGVLAHFRQGQAYYCAGQAEQAVSAWAAAGTGSFFAASGKHALDQQRLDEAHTLLDIALSIEPDSPFAWLYAGELAQRQEAYPAARAAYQRASHLNAQLGAPLVRLAALTIKLHGDYAEAQKQLLQALNLDPADPEVHVLLGQIAQEKGDLPQAIWHYQRAQQLAPSYVYSYILLGELHLSQAQVDQAWDSLQSGLRQVPSHPLIHASLARYYLAVGQPEAGLSEYRKAIKLAPWNKDLHSLLAAVYVEQGKLAEALLEYQEILILDPTDEFAREQLRRHGD